MCWFQSLPLGYRSCLWYFYYMYVTVSKKPMGGFTAQNRKGGSPKGFVKEMQLYFCSVIERHCWGVRCDVSAVFVGGLLTLTTFCLEKPASFILCSKQTHQQQHSGLTCWIFFIIYVSLQVTLAIWKLDLTLCCWGSERQLNVCKVI